VSTRAPARLSAGEFVRRVTALAGTDEWLIGDVDASAVLDEALAQLGRTGAHRAHIARLDAARTQRPAPTLALEAVALLRDAITLRSALRGPLSRSRALAAGAPVFGPDGVAIDLTLRADVPGHLNRQPVTLHLGRGDVLLRTPDGPLPLASALETLDAIAAGTRLDVAGVTRELAALSRALGELPHISRA
jgi:hypothetical protein